MYQKVEAEGAFPMWLRCILVHLVPRGKGPQPLDQRPIGVLPKLYWVWAGARAVDIRGRKRNH
eukprot:2999433-Alexandrium_andersonii.AAC.1